MQIEITPEIISFYRVYDLENNFIEGVFYADDDKGEYLQYDRTDEGAIQFTQKTTPGCLSR